MSQIHVASEISLAAGNEEALISAIDSTYEIYAEHSVVISFAQSALSLPGVWPVKYPSESRWIFGIFARSLNKVSAMSVSDLDAVDFLADMHQEFISDWLPLVVNLRERLCGLARSSQSKPVEVPCRPSTPPSAWEASLPGSRQWVPSLEVDSPDEDLSSISMSMM